MTWSKDELGRIAAADDLHPAPLCEDGVTCGTPTWIWSVAVDGALRPMIGAHARSATVKVTPLQDA